MRYFMCKGKGKGKRGFV